jgi:hypothetical protein
MPIELTCPCGKVLQLADNATGAGGQCPVCGRVVSIPVAADGAHGAITADPGREALPAFAADTAVAAGSPPLTPEVAPETLDHWGDIARPPYKLWSPGAIGAVAFLAGPVGALMMMAINYARLGKRSAAAVTAVCCVVGPIALIAVASALPDNNPIGFILAIPVFVTIWMTARSLQGGLYEAHLGAGGETASGGSAVGMAVLGLVLFLGGCAGAGIALDLVGASGFGTRIDFGGGQEIYHTRGATAADAQALAKVLRDVGFFGGANPHPAAVQVARDRDRMIVAFIVQPWVLKDGQFHRELRAIGDQASAQAFGGRRVEVWLCDEFFNAKKKLP